MTNRTEKIIEISSSQNAQFKMLKSLTESKGLKQEDLCLLSGRKLIQEFLQQNSEDKIIAEICTLKTSHDLFAKNLSINKYILTPELFKEIDELGTKQNILLIKQPEVSTFAIENHKDDQSLILLSPLGDPNNLGALIRSAEAFGVKTVVLLQEAAHPFLPKTIKSSAGSVLRMNLKKGPSVRELKQINIPKKSLIVLDLQGQPLPEFQWPKNCFLLIGEEGPGAPEDLAATRLNIPTNRVESLNAVVAASIAMYDFTTKNRKS